LFGLDDNNYYAEQIMHSGSGENKILYTPVRDKTFSEQDFYDHIDGKRTYGVYTINKNNMTSRFLCIDIDLPINEKMMEEAKRLARELTMILEEYEIDRDRVLYEFSGAKGIHLFIFFDEPIPAKSAHRLGNDIKKRALAATGQNFEVFPKQGELSADNTAIGSLLKLPLGKHLKTGMFSRFLEKEFLGEYTGDPELMLKTISKIRKEQVDAVLSTLDYEERTVDYSTNKEAYDINSNGYNFQNMVKTCSFFKYCETQVNVNKALNNDARKFLLTICIKFGKEGEDYILGLLSKLEGFNLPATQKRIAIAKREGYKPARCRAMIYNTNPAFCEFGGYCKTLEDMGFKYPVNPTALAAPIHYRQKNDLENPIKLEHLAEINDDTYNNMVVEIPFKVVTNAADYRMAWKDIYASCSGYQECNSSNCHLFKTGERSLSLKIKPETMIELAQCPEEQIVSIIKRNAFPCPLPPKKSGLRVFKTNDITMQKLVISSASNNFHSSVKIGDDGKVEYDDSVMVDEFGYKYQEKLAFYFGSDLEMDQMYKGIAHVIRNPKNGQKIMLIHSTKKFEYDTFKFNINDEQTRSHLQLFAKKSIDQILEDITYGITRIYDRNRLLLSVLLTYSSGLEFIFNNKQERGWVESIVLGDPGLGKTAVVSAIIKATGLGDICSGHTISRAGLAGGIEKEKNFDMHMIRWGIYPQNNEKLLVIDEAQGMPYEAGLALRSARESGVVKINGIVSGSHYAKTRLVWISNAKNNKVLNQFDCGFEALKELMDPAEIRRFDLAITIASGNQNAALANMHWREAQKRMPLQNTEITAEVLKSNILYAWTRKGRNIYFPESVEEYILQPGTGKAIELANKYSGAEDIPLVNRSDARLTIARLSAAMAILKKRNILQENWENVTVTKEDVDDVMDLIYKNYDEDSSRLNVYSLKYTTENYLNKDEVQPLIVDVIGRIKSESMGPGSSGVENSITYQAVSSFFNRSTLKVDDLMSMTGASSTVVLELFGWLLRKNLVYMSDRHNSEYTMRTRLKTLLNIMDKAGILSVNMNNKHSDIVYGDDQAAIALARGMLTE